MWWSHYRGFAGAPRCQDPRRRKCTAKPLKRRMLQQPMHPANTHSPHCRPLPKPSTSGRRGQPCNAPETRWQSHRCALTDAAWPVACSPHGFTDRRLLLLYTNEPAQSSPASRKRMLKAQIAEPKCAMWSLALRLLHEVKELICGFYPSLTATGADR